MPDHHIYEEALCETGADGWAVRAFSLADFSDSPQDPKQKIYDFEPAPALDEVKEWMKEAEAEAKYLFRDKGEGLASESRWFLRSGEWSDMTKGFEEKRSIPICRIMRTVAGKLKEDRGDDLDDGNDSIDSPVWLTLGKTDRFNPGDVIDDADLKVFRDSRGVVKVSTSEFFVVQVNETVHKSSFKEVAKALTSDGQEAGTVDDEMDAHVMPIMYLGGRIESRYCRWQEAADAITEARFDDWALKCPVRNADWCS